MASYVTQEELEDRLDEVNSAQEELDEKLMEITVNKKSVASKLVDILANLVEGACTVAVVTYFGMSCAYGPYDAGKVIYAELSGNKGLKHGHIEEAKGIYAKKRHLLELNDMDMRVFYLGVGAVGSNGKMPADEDVSWYNLLDWIEKNE